MGYEMLAVDVKKRLSAQLIPRLACVHSCSIIYGGQYPLLPRSLSKMPSSTHHLDRTTHVLDLRVKHIVLKGS